MSDIQSYEGRSNVETVGNNGIYNFGQYYRFTPPENVKLGSFIEGEIYIVSGLGIHHISQNVHNVTLYIPRHLREYEHNETVRLNVKDIELCFTFVEPEDASKERQQLLGHFEQQALGIREDLTLALKSPHSILEKAYLERNQDVKEAMSKIDMTIPALPSPDVMNANSTSIISTSKGKSIDVVRRQLKNQQQLGEVVTVYAREKNKELSNVVANVASIKMEEAAAVKGQAQSMMQSVGDVESKIEQLTLYLGEQIDVVTIVDKPESTSREKIHFFSAMLYLDEEMLTENIFSDGEFDYRNVESFYDRLVDTQSFRERIFPTQRCVVVVRPRREEKVYTACPFTNLAMNTPNFESFLMVRDGDRISAIYSSITYQARMFPTQAEMDSYFSGVLDVEDVKLTDAQRQMKLANDMYMKVAAILQGVVDRQESGGKVVFGDLPVSAFSSSFFDPQLIALNVTFVNDEDGLLASEGYIANPRNWLKKHTTDSVFEHDLVYVDKSIINYESASQAYYQDVNYHYEPQQRWFFNEKPFDNLKLVARKKDKLAIRVTMKNEHYDPLKDKTRSMSVNVKSAYDLFNIRFVKFSELNKIIASRSARPVIQNTNIMTSLLSARRDIQKLMDIYAEYVEALTNRMPDLDGEDAYINSLNYVLESGGKYDNPPKPTKNRIEEIVALIENKTTVNSDLMTSSNLFARERNETPVVVVGDVFNTYLVTNKYATPVELPVFNNAQDFFARNTLFTNLYVYQVKGKEFEFIGPMTAELDATLRIKSFFPWEGDKPRSDNLSFRGANLESITEVIYNRSISLTEYSPLVVVQRIQRDKEEALLAQSLAQKVSDALCSDDNEKSKLVEQLSVQIASECWLERIQSFNQSKKEVAIPRLSYAAGVHYEVLNRHNRDTLNLKAVFGLFDYYVAMTRLIFAIKDELLRDTLLEQFKDVLAQSGYKSSGIDAWIESWRKRDVTSCFLAPIDSGDLKVLDSDAPLASKSIAPSDIGMLAV